MVELVRQEMAKNPDLELGAVIPHQMNQRIIEAARERLELPENAVYVNIMRYGNTSAASIPLALDEARRTGFFAELRRQARRVLRLRRGPDLGLGGAALVSAPRPAWRGAVPGPGQPAPGHGARPGGRPTRRPTAARARRAHARAAAARDPGRQATPPALDRTDVCQPAILAVSLAAMAPRSSGAG
jgi:hypothetical protein